MNTNSRIPLSDLPLFLKERCGAFICCASFEARSSCIPDSIKSLPFKRVLVFATDDCYPGIKDVALRIKKIFADRAEIVTTKTHEPLFTANAIAKAVRRIFDEGIDDIIIDITTFTHEMLLILLKQISDHRKLFPRVKCVYLGAQDYSFKDPIERKWLSKGCKEVRSVFGFPGQLVPGRPTCLIVLVGFEHERATRMIIEMDPEYLLLGKGMPSVEHLTHEAHKAPMEYFHRLVKDMVSSRGAVDSFEFSCRNHNQTTQSLLSKIHETEDYNHIIVPLNTKISTVAVALTAFQYPALQVCYAEPETYNFDAYSKPGDNVTIFDILKPDQAGSETYDD